MLSGLEAIDSGEAFIAQSCVNTELDAARKKLGLCPQFDALLGSKFMRNLSYIRFPGCCSTDCLCFQT